MTQALQIIAYAAALACYGAMTFFTVSAWFRLRRMERKMGSLRHWQRMVFAMMIDGNIHDNMDSINRMKRDLQQLIADDRFEDAQRLQKVINERESYISEQLQYIREEFSDECEVKMYATPNVNAATADSDDDDE